MNGALHMLGSNITMRVAEEGRLFAEARAALQAAEAAQKQAQVTVTALSLAPARAHALAVDLALFRCGARSVPWRPRFLF